MKRFSAALGALVLAGAVTLGVTGTAEAASQMDCNTAAAATATAQTNFNNALNVAVARAKELGFTSAQLKLAQSILSQGTITDAQKTQLMMIYSEHANMFSATADLAKVKAVLDTRFALSAAQAAQTIACNGFTPQVTLAPGAVVLQPAMPTGAPRMGDGTVFGR